MKLQEKLIVLRKEKGWSQEDFAEKLDVSRQAISRWENGTALPDALNILGISKLFNVTADYLLNDELDEEVNVHMTATKETNPEMPKKKESYWYSILAIGLIILLSVFAIAVVMKDKNEEHKHPELTRIIENEISPTCTVQGSYDEVIYCTECGEEVMRTHISSGIPSHQFYNEKCIICGKEQRERD